MERSERDELLQQIQDLKQSLATEKYRADKAESKVAPEAKNKSVVYLKKGKKLPILKGRPCSNDDPCVEDWVTDVKRHINDSSLSASEKKDYILDHIDGNVKHEVNARNLSDPTEILNAIKKTFGITDSVGSLQQNFFCRSQKAGETLLDFSISLLRLNEQISQKDEAIPAKMLKGRFIEGVLDDSLKRELRKLNHEQPNLNFCEFRDKSVEWVGKESLVKKDTSVWETSTAVASASNTSSVEKQLKEQKEEISELKKLVERSLEQKRAPSPAPSYYARQQSYQPRHTPRGPVNRWQSNRPSNPWHNNTNPQARHFNYGPAIRPHRPET